MARRDLSWKPVQIPAGLYQAAIAQDRAAERISQGLSTIGNVFEKYVTDKTSRETSNKLEDLYMADPDDYENIFREARENQWVDMDVFADTLFKLEDRALRRRDLELDILQKEAQAKAREPLDTSQMGSGMTAGTVAGGSEAAQKSQDVVDIIEQKVDAGEMSAEDGISILRQEAAVANETEFPVVDIPSAAGYRNEIVDLVSGGYPTPQATSPAPTQPAATQQPVPAASPTPSPASEAYGDSPIDKLIDRQSFADAGGFLFEGAKNVGNFVNMLPGAAYNTSQFLGEKIIEGYSKLAGGATRIGEDIKRNNELRRIRAEEAAGRMREEARTPVTTPEQDQEDTTLQEIANTPARPVMEDPSYLLRPTEQTAEATTPTPPDTATKRLQETIKESQRLQDQIAEIVDPNAVNMEGRTYTGPVIQEGVKQVLNNAARNIKNVGFSQVEVANQLSSRADDFFALPQFDVFRNDVSGVPDLVNGLTALRKSLAGVDTDMKAAVLDAYTQYHGYSVEDIDEPSEVQALTYPVFKQMWIKRFSDEGFMNIIDDMGDQFEAINSAYIEAIENPDILQDRETFLEQNKAFRNAYDDLRIRMELIARKSGNYKDFMESVGDAIGYTTTEEYYKKHLENEQDFLKAQATTRAKGEADFLAWVDQETDKLGETVYKRYKNSKVRDKLYTLSRDLRTRLMERGINIAPVVATKVIMQQMNPDGFLWTDKFPVLRYEGTTLDDEEALTLLESDYFAYAQVKNNVHKTEVLPTISKGAYTALEDQVKAIKDKYGIEK